MSASAIQKKIEDAFLRDPYVSSYEIEVDVITRFDGKAVDSAHEVSRLVASKKPDSEVGVSIVHDGEKKELTLQIGTMDDGKQAGLDQSDKSEKKWGLSVQPLTPQLAQRLGYGKDENGLVVSKVEALSPAAEAGIRRGDLIKEINRREIQDMEDLQSIIEDASEKDSLLIDPAEVYSFQRLSFSDRALTANSSIVISLSAQKTLMVSISSSGRRTVRHFV